MRNLLLVCAGLVVVSGIVSVNLWRELRSERALAAQLREQVAEAGQRATPGRLSAQPAPPSSSVDSVAQAVVQVPAAGPEAAGAAPASASPAAPNPDVRRIIFNQQELMKDPEYRKAQLAQSRLMLPQTYPGLAEELGLTPEEADELFDLLAENQLEMSELTMSAATINGVAPDPATQEEVNRRRPEMQRRHDESLLALLGSARHGQWQDYQQTRGARMQVAQLGRTLESAGLPMSAEQSRPLTAAYIAEQKRMREELQRLNPGPGQSASADQERLMEESFRLQTESNRRILDAARPHLSAQQIEALQASLDQQLAMSRASSRLMRQRMRAQGVDAAGAMTVITTAPMPLPVP